MGEYAERVRRDISDGVVPVRQNGARANRRETMPPSGVPQPEGIPPDVQTELARRLHYDFSRVRVHADEQAASTAASVGARAFADGNHLFFGAGQYDPSTRRGRRLLAHELTHVIQADATRAQPSASSDEVPALESEARSVAAAFATGGPVPPVLGVARSLRLPLRAGPDDEPPVEDRPTFGNLPQDKPLPGWSETHRRVELFEKDGVWYQRGFRPETKARGSYDFVIKDGKIYGVKGGSRGYGHTELAGGGRVEYAGQVEFEGGICKEWSNASGHYAAVRNFRDVAVKAGLPADRFVPLEGLRPPEGGPQLPVFQPKAGHLHKAGEPLGPPGPESPAPDVGPSVPEVTPEVAPPVEGPPITVAGSILGSVVKNAIAIAIGLIIQWGLSKLIQAEIEADVTETLNEQLPQKLNQLKPRLDQLRGKGDLYIRISYDYYYSRTPDPIMALSNPPFYEPGSVRLINVHPGNEELNFEPSHTEYPEPWFPQRERVKVRSSYSVLLDDSFSKAQARARQERLQTPRQSPLQRTPPHPPPPASPTAPAPSLLPAPGPAPQQPFTPLPGAPGPSPLQEAMDKVAVARYMTEALLSRGAALEQRLGSGNPPSPQERKAFAADEEQWRLAATKAWEAFKQRGDDEARAAFDELLHSDKYGGRLAQIREHLGE